MRAIPGILVITVAALVGACQPRTGGAPATAVTGEIGETGETGGSGGSSDAGSAGTASTSGSSTADPGTAGATTSADPAPAPTTSGGVDESGCPAYCAKLEACGDPDGEGCAVWCADAETGYRFIGEACLALYIHAEQCVAGLTCAQLDAEPQACADEYDALKSQPCTVEGCRDMCAKRVECGVPGPDDELTCAVKCSAAQAEALLEAGTICATSIANYYACFVTRPCDMIDPLQGCEEEVAAKEAACG